MSTDHEHTHAHDTCSSHVPPPLPPLSLSGRLFGRLLLVVAACGGGECQASGLPQARLDFWDYITYVNGRGIGRFDRTRGSFYSPPLPSYTTYSNHSRGETHQSCDPHSMKPSCITEAKTEVNMVFYYLKSVCREPRKNKEQKGFTLAVQHAYLTPVLPHRLHQASAFWQADLQP